MSIAPAPSIGVTMYLHRESGQAVCEKHKADPWGVGKVLIAFTTLSSDGCAVCETTPEK